jgi:hypothetical protein
MQELPSGKKERAGGIRLPFGSFTGNTCDLFGLRSANNRSIRATRRSSGLLPRLLYGAQGKRRIKIARPRIRPQPGRGDAFHGRQAIRKVTFCQTRRARELAAHGRTRAGKVIPFPHLPLAQTVPDASAILFPWIMASIQRGAGAGLRAGKCAGIRRALWSQSSLCTGGCGSAKIYLAPADFQAAQRAKI